MKITPMMQQYLDAKEKYPDTLVFFRMGDFYELFFDDARTASDILDITLTSRSKGPDGENIPMAGVPHHAASGYIQKLVRAGFKVAICEQLEDPSLAKGLVDRDVVRVITPGLCLEGDGLEARESNFLAALVPLGKGSEPFLVAACDISTGEVHLAEVVSAASLPRELDRASVRELLLPEGLAELEHNLQRHPSLHLTMVPRDYYKATSLIRAMRDLDRSGGDARPAPGAMSVEEVEAYLAELKELDYRQEKGARAGLSCLLRYLLATQKRIPANLSTIQIQRPQDHVALDSATEANLEIFETLIGGARSGSLLSVIDQTVTAAGGRRLRTVLAYPLIDVEQINRRLDAVEQLTASELRRSAIRDSLRQVADISRLTGRVVNRTASARDLVALGRSLGQIPALLVLREPTDPPLLAENFDQMDPCQDLVELLGSSLVDDPPLSTTEGGMFQEGYHPDLDELIALSRDGKKWLLAYEQTQRQQTGIDSLKVKFNKVFGYFIEVTKANLERIPDHYIRKQTLVGGERFFTVELKEYEDKILHAEERRSKLESRLFEELAAHVTACVDRLLRTSLALAELDVLAGFAELAVRNRYVRPVVDDSRITHIEDGRHPVVEKTTAGERFIPNTVHLDADNEQLLVVTGPNMAGKSTIIRQVALIALLAQIGSFVPAAQATLGVVDQIFSRVGASDNLAQGLSTFMVEMTQTSHILQHATERSLVILDEIGRGTSTFDGLSIAWAVAEYLVDHIGARTMFATHYHELTELARSRERVRNVSVAVKEWNDEIVFLRRLVQGPSNKSYGIQVGRLAGLPGSVVERAKQILGTLELTTHDPDSGPIHTTARRKSAPDAAQLDLFAALPSGQLTSDLLAKLEAVDPDTLTPIEALQLIYSLKQTLKSG
ncbi:MAG: DNA mismatch repair protein MutS [Bradymonadales bacterium]|nr:DNA mismatch repair protein MutS [Bradymonadales bacterium]